MRYQSSGKRSGFTVLELMVVVFVVAILVGLLLPRLGRRHVYSSQIGCANKLKQVGLSFRMWAGDNGDRFPMQVSTNSGGTMEFVDRGRAYLHFQVLSNELGTPRVLECRADERTAATNFTTDFNDSRVSYFVGLNATQASTNAFLCGDRKLEDASGDLIGIRDITSKQKISWKKSIHEGHGNIALADGSVMRLKTSELQKALANTGLVTNRLAFPGGAN